MEILNYMNLAVQLGDDRVQDPVVFNLGKTLFRKNSKPNVLDMILKTDVGVKFDITENDSARRIEKTLFKNFEARHKSDCIGDIFKRKKEERDYFQRNKKLKNELQPHYTIEKKNQNQVHPAQIRDGFQRVLFKLVPYQLLGNNRNKKKILKSLYNLLITAKTESYSLLDLLQRLNVESIEWLNSIDDQQQKYIILAKFVKWLFQYFMAIIYHQFRLLYVKEQRIFIRISDFCNQEKDYIKKLEKKMVLRSGEAKSDNLEERPKRLILLPKKDGLRPILKFRYSDQEKEVFKKACCILTYLHKTYLKSTNDDFNKKYIEIVKDSNRMCNENKVYMVSCDIVNAYGSIRQAKLFEIIQDLFENLPNELVLKRQNKKSRTKYTYLSPENGPMRRGARGMSIEIITKIDILHFIKSNIYNPKLKFNLETYYLRKGISQGLSLSAILCDIYYMSMRKKYFSMYEEQGLLFHYVDDSLYITTNRKYAELYLERVRKGIPEYNCWFNKSKLKCNFNASGDIENSSTISFLGMRFQCDSLQVEPKYESARYSTTYASLSYKSFKMRIQNVSALKINELVLCKEINSEEWILKNVQMIAMQQAKRCFSCINYHWTNHTKFSLKVVRDANVKLIKMMVKLTNWDDSKKEQYKEFLQDIIWKSFYRVFRNNPNLVKICFPKDNLIGISKL